MKKDEAAPSTGTHCGGCGEWIEWEDMQDHINETDCAEKCIYTDKDVDDFIEENSELFDLID